MHFNLEVISLDSVHICGSSVILKKKINSRQIGPLPVCFTQTTISSQIAWSDNLLHQFQEETMTQWTRYRAKLYSHREFMVMGTPEIFSFSCWKPEGGHRNHHHFQQIPVPPASAGKFIWPNCRKEKGVGKGNNNCYSYQCLCHLHAGAAPNNFASFWKSLFTPVALYCANGSHKFSAIPMAQGGCHLSLWMWDLFGSPPPWVIGVRKCDYIWAEGERCCEKANWTDIVNIYFFSDGRQLYLCAVVKQKRYWVLVQELYTNCKKCIQWELIIETYSSRIIFFNKHVDWHVEHAVLKRSKLDCGFISGIPEWTENCGPYS